jgi:hypothetical protein
MARKRLTITEIDSVGGVDEGDNPGALLAFFKRRKHTPNMGEDTQKGVAMNEGEAETVETAAEPEAEVGKSIEAEVEAEAAVEVEDLAKRALEEEIAKAHQERDAAVASLAEEVAKARKAEWIGKARPYELLLGPASEMGPALGRIADVLPDEYARLETALKAAIARVDLAKILVEVGKDTGETRTPMQQRDDWVKEFLTKNPKETQAQARALFWNAHPDLKQASRERN